jgi:hypothetical protein
MAIAVHDQLGDLPAHRCRELLLTSSHGFVGCTYRALPLVVPAEIACVDGQLLVRVRDRQLCGPLTGQVVALAVGRRARPQLLGWTVLARGRLGASPADGAASLPLDIGTLQGWTFEAGTDPDPTAAVPELHIVSELLDP